MKIINPSYMILTELDDGKEILKDIEFAARSCYKSEDRITKDSAVGLIKNLVKRGHTAMLEFGDIVVKFICNRGFTHEMVRHRLASYAQESTRYCNYSKEKFGNELTFILPPFLIKEHEDLREIKEVEKQTVAYSEWIRAMIDAEVHYLRMINVGCSPNEARGVLPIDIKTEITVKANLTEWRHIFSKRTPNTAHPSMQQLMRPLCEELKTKIPILFDEFVW